MYTDGDQKTPVETGRVNRHLRDQYGPEKRTRRDPYPLVYHRDHYTPVETRRHPYTLVYYQRPIDTSRDQKTPIHTSILPETFKHQ